MVGYRGVVAVVDDGDLPVPDAVTRFSVGAALDRLADDPPAVVVVGHVDEGSVAFCRRLTRRLPGASVVAVVDGASAVNDAVDAGATVALLRDDPALADRLANCIDRMVTNSQYETIVHGIDAATWVANGDISELHYLSPQYAEVFGHPTELLENDAWGDMQFIHPDDRERARATFECWAAGRFPTAQYRVIHPSGDVRWVFERAGHATRPDGTTVITGYAIDATPLKRVEDEFRSRTERLERFSSTVSHDLRNPINSAMGWLELAQTGQADPVDALDRVDRALARTDEIIDGLLALARDDVTPRETTDLETVALETWDLLAPSNATLTTESLPTVQADEALLRNLFENFFRNSLEHGRDGDTHLTVRVGSLPEGGFYVADDGVGVSSAERDHVFTFGHTTGEGTGLGLGIVDRIVRAHDWSVAVVESEDGGARFEVTDVESSGDEADD